MAKVTKKRLYLENEVLDHDLYKLELSMMKKNVSYSDKHPRFEDVEHTHFYHTIDSSGVAMTVCSPTGSHCHEMIMKKAATKDSPAEYECGPAVKRVMVKTRSGNKYHVKKEFRQISFDQHTHNVTYLHSQKVKARKMNEEFMKYKAAVATKEAKQPQSLPEIKEQDSSI